MNFLDYFERQPDGSWKCVKPVYMTTPHGELGIVAGRTFRPGETFMGMVMVAELERAALLLDSTFE